MVSTAYDFKKNQEFSTLNNILKEIGFTGFTYRNSTCHKFFRDRFPQRIECILEPSPVESDFESSLNVLEAEYTPEFSKTILLNKPEQMWERQQLF